MSSLSDPAQGLRVLPVLASGSYPYQVVAIKCTTAGTITYVDAFDTTPINLALEAGDHHAVQIRRITSMGTAVVLGYIRPLGG